MLLRVRNSKISLGDVSLNTLCTLIYNPDHREVRRASLIARHIICTCILVPLNHSILQRTFQFKAVLLIRLR